jgi:hypothetical protein
MGCDRGSERVKSNELKKQKLLAELLNIEFTHLQMPAQAFTGNDFKRIDGHWANKPDLIIINAPRINHPRLLQPEIMKPVIGIEMKDKTSFGDIVNGLPQTKNYFDYEYKLEKKDLTFKLSSLAFTTTNAIATGVIDKKFEDNKAIERFAWKQQIAILKKYKEHLVWSFRNYYFRIDGKVIGRFGEHARFIEY